MPNFLTTLLVLVGTVLGVTVAFSLEMQYGDLVAEVIEFSEPRIVLGILFGGIGYLVASTAAWEFQQWFEKKLPTLRISDFFWGASGFIVGAIAANLIMVPVIVFTFNENVSQVINQSPLVSVILPVAVIIIPLFLNFFMGYLGMTVFIRKQSELVSLFSSKLRPQITRDIDLKILDTSAVIDGRILDILPTSILEGRLSVPLFVLNEMHLIADSTDHAKRSRGKRGFEILEQLKSNTDLELDFPTVDYPDVPQVDAKLIEYAKETGGKIITNDFALYKLAHLQEVQVINLNEVSNALRPVVLSGEKMEIHIVKKGKGADQGVGYLNDGTMVVVEGAADIRGETRTVIVTSVQQSSVGRMIFAAVERPTGGQ